MRYSRPRSSCSDYSRSSKSRPKMETKWKERTNSGIINDTATSRYIPKSVDSGKKKSRSKSVIIEPNTD